MSCNIGSVAAVGCVLVPLSVIFPHGRRTCVPFYVTLQSVAKLRRC
uniref:Uncharacterized protein n=1 Tax=Anguilla anguilla TaxID=7936 RepID=A0A0E9UYB6_ANGAN